MAKIIDIRQYKARKEQKSLDNDMKQMSQDLEFAMKYGVCDYCNIACEDARLMPTTNSWCCDGCVPEMAQRRNK